MQMTPKRSMRWLGVLFREQATALVRLARFFVDNRDAAEDIVQEAFIRLARSAHQIQERDRAAAYLRSIVLNLARDHNRRGLVSLPHRPPGDPAPASVEELVAVRADQQRVVAALRELPLRQRDCLLLRHSGYAYAEIAATLGIALGSVGVLLARAEHAFRTIYGRQTNA